ncbi:MAG: branched-chain amino acid ABC transporter substrate-binding protein [Burkholderiales bacterium]
MLNALKRCLVAALFATSGAVGAAETIKLALIEPLSGPFAQQGNSSLHMFQMLFEEINAKGGVLGGRDLELVAFDNKASPQESLLALRQVVDQGVRVILQASGSHNAHALSEAITKHNSRDPRRSILYLNFGAVDTALTNEKCSFWHFRFDSNVDMKMAAMTAYMATRKDIRNVYLINQDYAYGHTVSRVGKQMLAAKRPDVTVVGDELHPIGKIKDFAPYVAKIKASGADTVLSGNWGNDLALLIKAAADVRLPATFYTNYAYLTGTPKAIGRAGEGRIKTVLAWHINVDNSPLVSFALRFKSRFNEDFMILPALSAIEMWMAAMERAGTSDPLKVALALEDMRYPGPTGELWMRRDDHQLIQPLYIATFTKVGGELKHDLEGTGYGFRTDMRVEAKDTTLPTTCKMERP